MITSEEIKGRLWDGANELRGSMDASRYKDYMLGLMFYKFLSDKTLDTFKKTSGIKEGNETEIIEAYREAYEQYGERLVEMLRSVLGYYADDFKGLFSSSTLDLTDTALGSNL